MYKTNKKMTKAEMRELTDFQYYKEHKKHHSEKHIKAMKELQKKYNIDREDAHRFVKKYVE
jgi:hypothetical protein